IGTSLGLHPFRLRSPSEFYLCKASRRFPPLLVKGLIDLAKALIVLVDPVFPDILGTVPDIMVIAQGVRAGLALVPVVREDPAAHPMVVVVPARDGMGSLGVGKCRLTGSRYFGTHRRDSDWDFFAQDSPIARSALLKRGLV